MLYYIIHYIIFLSNNKLSSISNKWLSDERVVQFTYEIVKYLYVTKAKLDRSTKSPDSHE